MEIDRITSRDKHENKTKRSPLTIPTDGGPYPYVTMFNTYLQRDLSCDPRQTLERTWKTQNCPWVKCMLRNCILCVFLILKGNEINAFFLPGN